MDIRELTERALDLERLYDELNQRDRGRSWTREEFVLGFVGDVGDLAELALGAEGVREMPGGQAALAHELADCLWSVLVLADRYGVDLESAFQETVGGLASALEQELGDGSSA